MLHCQYDATDAWLDSFYAVQNGTLALGAENSSSAFNAAGSNGTNRKGKHSTFMPDVKACSHIDCRWCLTDNFQSASGIIYATQ